MKQHSKAKPLKCKSLPRFAEAVDSKHINYNAVSTQILSTSEDLHLPSQITYVQENSKLFDTAGTKISQQPVSGTFHADVTMHLKAATKKDQFRKMKNYHNHVIQHPCYIHHHAMTGADAVKYLEHSLQEV